MWRKEIEVILARQLASYLALPIFIVDVEGNLLFYNEPAEDVLGRRFEETGWMDSETWRNAFGPVDEEGCPIPASELPLNRALRLKRPAHRRLWLPDKKGGFKAVEVTAFPLAGIGDRLVGAVSIFWEQDSQEKDDG